MLEEPFVMYFLSLLSKKSKSVAPRIVACLYEASLINDSNGSYPPV